MDQDFYDRVGVVALGSRLRRLGDWLAEDARRVFQDYGTDLEPRWFPVFHLLTERAQASVKDIAAEIGHTHASVSQIVRAMERGGYVRTRTAPDDGRRTLACLSPRGRAAAARVKLQCHDAEKAAQALLVEGADGLWSGLGAVERALRHRSFVKRVSDVRADREGAGGAHGPHALDRRNTGGVAQRMGAMRSTSVQIVNYEPRFGAAFRRINEEWIRTHFRLEQTDRAMLNDPEGRILRPGGAILIALLDGRPVGTCALLPHGARCFELAKMGVLPAARGRGIGLKLGEAAKNKAAELGATELYLETNSKLAPAIALYHKLGFRETSGHPSPYARCDYQMALELPAAS